MRVGLLPWDAPALCERDVNGVHSGTIRRSGRGLRGRGEGEGEKKEKREKPKVVEGLSTCVPAGAAAVED